MRKRFRVAALLLAACMLVPSIASAEAAAEATEVPELYEIRNDELLQGLQGLWREPTMDMVLEIVDTHMWLFRFDAPNDALTDTEFGVFRRRDGSVCLQPLEGGSFGPLKSLEVENGVPYMTLADSAEASDPLIPERMQLPTPAPTATPKPHRTKKPHTHHDEEYIYIEPVDTDPFIFPVGPHPYPIETGIIAFKPVIYLYPETETEVEVSLALNGGALTCTYPSYGDGWHVTAQPDGTLTDASGRTYSYLYWEGTHALDTEQADGFCVAGEDSAAFLEQSLEALGLNRREANEFIVYWLPQLEQSPYNLISFRTDSYVENAVLTVEPAPDTVLRVFMTYRPLEAPVEIPAQTLTAPERTGFTVVEWGGTRIG